MEVVKTGDGGGGSGGGGIGGGGGVRSALRNKGAVESRVKTEPKRNPRNR